MPHKDQPLFTISSAARLLDVHPQTLRLYERLGLIKPARTRGNTRLYSEHDLERMRLILHLRRDLGVNLAGVDIILRMRHEVEQLQQEVVELRQRLEHCQAQQATVPNQARALLPATTRKLMKVS